MQLVLSISSFGVQLTSSNDDEGIKIVEKDELRDYPMSEIRNYDDKQLASFIEKLCDLRYNEGFYNGYKTGHEEGSEEAEIQYQESWDDIPGPFLHWLED